MAAEFEWDLRKSAPGFPESFEAKAGRLALVVARSSAGDGWNWWIEGLGAAHEVEMGRAPSRGLAMVAVERAFWQAHDASLPGQD